MADRTSAGIFGDIFNYLAGEEKMSKEEFAQRLWSDAGGYDFSYDQMGCHEALIKLGLAVTCGCGGIVYKGEAGSYHNEPECNPEDWKNFAGQD